MKKHLPLILIILWGLLLSIPPAQAQSTSNVAASILQVEQVGIGPQGGLLLDISFTLRETITKKPLPNAQFIESNVVLGSTTYTTESVQTVSKRTNIALLLDASNSMTRVMPQVKEAASKSIDSLSSNMYVAVFAFTQVRPDAQFIPLSDDGSFGFTNNKQRIQSDINQVQAVTQGETCLFNASHKAIEYIRKNTRILQGELGAVVMFTDGRDETKSGNVCSTRSYEDVVNVSYGSAKVPVHTIGLCRDAQCSNVDQALIERLAQDTSGYSSVGDDLDSMFRDIIQALKSQWVARVEVFPNRGEQAATLRLNLEGHGQISTDFRFNSSDDYFGRPKFSLNVEYDSDADVYYIQPLIQNPRATKELVLQVYDKRRGSNVPNMRLTRATNTLHETFELPTSNLEPDREYCFRLYATRLDGSPIETDKGEQILNEHCGTYEPRFGFAVTSYLINYEADTLQVNLDIRGAGERVLQVQGQILQENGNVIENLEPKVLDKSSKQFVIKIPKDLRKQANGQQNFRFNLTLSADGEAPIAPYHIEKFVPASAPKTSLVTKFMMGLSDPIVWLSLLFVAAVVTVAVWYTQRTKGDDLVISSPPPTELTGRLTNSSESPTPRTNGTTKSAKHAIKAPPVGQKVLLRIHILEHPSCTGTYEISNLPLIIGRGDQADFQIPADNFMSKRHARIDLNPEAPGYRITSIGTNPIVINRNQSLVNVPVPFETSITVKLVNNIVIAIEPVSV